MRSSWSGWLKPRPACRAIHSAPSTRPFRERSAWDDLNGALSTLVTVTLEASNDGGQTFDVGPQATTGDVRPNVTPGAGKAIDWDSSKDIDDLQLDGYVFRVVVSPAAAPNVTALKIAILEGQNAVNSVREKRAESNDGGRTFAARDERRGVRTVALEDEATGRGLTLAWLSGIIPP